MGPGNGFGGFGIATRPGSIGVAATCAQIWLFVTDFVLATNGPDSHSDNVPGVSVRGILSDYSVI